MFATTNPMLNASSNEHENSVTAQYRGIMNNVNKMSNLHLHNQPLATKFVRELGTYLTTRMFEFRLFCLDNTRSIMERNNYIVSLVFLIQANNVNAQLEMLTEKNILRFKGFFSQRLYDALAAYRKTLEHPLSDTPSANKQNKR